MPSAAELSGEAIAVDLNVEWLAPIALADGSTQRLIYACDLAKLPAAPGVYVFARQFAKQTEALYVGQAQSIRARVGTQFKNLPLMKHLEGAKLGRRVVIVGVFRPRPGQRIPAGLTLIERALIRHFLTENHDLVNVMGARLRQHTVTSVGGKRLIPKLMQLDR